MQSSTLPKVSIIGAGNVGSTCAFLLTANSIADIYLFDKAENKVQAKALDIGQAAAGLNSQSRVFAAQEPEELKDSQVIIITAGIPRKQGISRQDLIKINAAVAEEIAHNIRRNAAGAIVLVVSNPLDILTYLVLRETGFDRRRVFGMAGIVDNSRLRYFVSQKTGVAANKVKSHVLGLHADQMVIDEEQIFLDDKPITETLNETGIEELKASTRNAGAQIVGLLGNGSAYYMPSTGAYLMARAVIDDTNEVFDTCVYLEGEYGLNDVCLGVPAKIGRQGVKEIVTLDLTNENLETLKKNAAIFEEQLRLL